ncbi:MAG: UDP-N-acetylglucosamine 1-carboxyvinyltransferase, partial [Oscillospiraceae bacterium]
MDFLRVEGGRPLVGSVTLDGAKNSILPLLCASVLCDGRSVFTNVPNLSDVRLACDVLGSLGVSAELLDANITVRNDGIDSAEIPRELMSGMRGTFMFLGSILSRKGRAVVYNPGGCKLGLRPVDIHLDALRALGANFRFDGDRLSAELPNGRFCGGEVSLRFPSVGATENSIFAAVLAEGTTRISGAACEPEISDVASFLNECGARISGAGESVIEIEGVRELLGGRHAVIPDRIAAATLLCATAVSRGDVTIDGAREHDVRAVVDTLRACGAHIVSSNASLRIQVEERLSGCGRVSCEPFPGFSTDAGPLLAAAMCFARGESEIYDSVFENRFSCADALRSLGADSRAVGRSIIIGGSATISGGRATAGDLRGAAALVCVALGCEGVSVIEGIEHLDRGYAALEKTLRS